MKTTSQGSPSNRSNNLDGLGPELHGPDAVPVEMPHAAGNTQQSSNSAVLNLPVDKPRAARSGAHFACHLCRLPQGLRDSLVDFSRRRETALPTVLLSAFHVLLLRYSGQENIEIGCALEGFPTQDGASGAYRFVLHTELAGDPAFDLLLTRTDADVREKLAYHDPSLLEVGDAEGCGNNGESPSFQVSFSSVSSPSAANLVAPLLIAGPPVDLHLEMAESRDELVLRLFYNANLFHAGSVARMQKNFQTLLEGVVADSGQKLSRLPLLTEDEKQQILVGWNQTQCEYPREKCLHELVEEQAECRPHAVAASCGTQTLAYSELNLQANWLARRLRSVGVGPNVRVGIGLTPSLDFAVAVLAVLKAGGSCLPLDPKYPQERLAYMLEDAQARVLITERGALPGGITANGCEVIRLSDEVRSLAAQDETNLGSKVKPGDIAYVIYTSGSTGNPRGVLLPHSGLVNYNWNMARLYGMKADDRVLQFCSISFDIAIEEMFIAWLSGATLVFKSEETPLSVPEFLAWAERERITVLDLPTAYWHEWVHSLPELEAPSPRNLRLVIVGGEKASSKAYAKWQSAVRDRVRWVNTYGPTEASIGATWSEPQWQAEEIPDNLPIGRPVPNARIYLLDRHLNPVPVGVPGELHIGGTGVALGYLNRPELTAEKFIADPFVESGGRLYKTGDLARYLSSGEIEFLGRRDDQIKIRGFRVELGEIEAALAKHPGVREVAVIAREAASGDKQLAAYLVAAQGTAVSTTGLRSFLQQQLPEYMVPSSFTVLEAMPLTPNGKINRRGLPEPNAEAVPVETVSTTDALQLQLLEIWQEVLGKKAVGLNDNFFDLGGHSLLAARLMHRTGQALGKTLPLAMLFEAPTVEQLAGALRQNGWSRHWSSLVPIQPAGSQPPFFCVHGVGGNVIGFSELARRMAPDYPFYGLQSQGLDGKHANHARIEDMAAHYLDEIRTVQPKGPYLFGGFSFGGLVAYEMAQQLRARGEDVSLLVLFDTYPGNLDPVGSSLMKLMLQPKRKNLVRDLTRAARKRIKRSFRGLMIPRLLKNVRNSNRTAADRYVLGPYAGKATLIRATEKSLRTFSDPHAAWKGLVAQLEIHDIPSDHYGILVEPQVQDLTQCLKSCIDQARANYEQSGVALQVS